jgi:hypothetical protein
MSELRDQFGLQMHTALRCLDTAPNPDSFDALAEVFNVVQVAIEHDAQRAHEARLINGGAMALIQVEQRVRAGKAPQPYEMAPIRVAVNTIDAMLGKLDVSGLYLAIQKLKSMREAA